MIFKKKETVKEKTKVYKIVSHISFSNADDFSKKLQEVCATLVHDNYEFEVQYQTAFNGNEIVYSAIVLAYNME